MKYPLKYVLFSVIIFSCIWGDSKTVINIWHQMLYENRKVLRESGTTFLLDAFPKTLTDRIHNTDKRPLLADSENLEDRLKTIWQDRSELYKNSAHHVIKTDELKPPEVLDKILKILEVNIADH